MTNFLVMVEVVYQALKNVMGHQTARMAQTSQLVVSFSLIACIVGLGNYVEAAT